MACSSWSFVQVGVAVALALTDSSLDLRPEEGDVEESLSLWREDEGEEGEEGEVGADMDRRRCCFWW